MFDISRLDFRTPSQAGAFMAFRHPATGEAVKDDAGKEVGVTLLGRYSDSFYEARQQLEVKRVDAAAAGKALTAEQEAAFLIAECTSGWTWTHIDNAEFPFSKENAHKFWNDPRYRVYRDAAYLFVSDLGNFTKS
jgi:hypothetical protein